MRKIDEIDENFKIETQIQRDGMTFYDCRDPRFDLRGITYSEEIGCFCRLPKNVAESVNDGVAGLYKHTAGGRLRFKSDTSHICIVAYVTQISKMSHMAFSGSIGFDLYEFKNGAERYLKTLCPPEDVEDKFESEIWLESAEEREFVINFPLYSGVKKLLIGLSQGSRIEKPHEYAHDIPIVYYGSSITQGGCASRPGNAYQSMISRRLDCDYLNLGFSGSARGEKVIADYISKLKMSAFVYDYDYNAPDSEHLRQTHKPMFDIIRKANPSLPIIIVSKPDISGAEDTDKRFEIIKQTYDAAIKSNDDNVYLIDGRKIMCGAAEDSGTVDGVHPNDLGFYSMAQKIGDVLEKIIKD